MCSILEHVRQGHDRQQGGADIPVCGEARGPNFAHCRSFAEYRSSLQLRWLQTSVRTSHHGARPRRVFVHNSPAFLTSRPQSN